MCSRPLASARSVPGSGCRCRCGALGGGGAPRVDHDVLRAALAARVEVLHRRRHRVGRVAADQHDDVGLGDVGERERQPAVDAERPVAGRGGRGHAEPAVVVDAAACAARRGRTCRAGRPSRWSARRRRSRRRRRGRARPACAVIAAAIRSSASSQLAGRSGCVAGVAGPAGWCSRSRVVEQLGGGPALRAQPAAVGREVGAADQLDRAVRPARQRHPALQRAVRAVRGDACGHHSPPVRPAGGVRVGRATS